MGEDLVAQSRADGLDGLSFTWISVIAGGRVMMLDPQSKGMLRAHTRRKGTQLSRLVKATTRGHTSPQFFSQTMYHHHHHYKSV